MIELLGLHSDLLNTQGSIELLLRLGIDLFFTGIIILGCYMKKYGKNEYIFTYVMLNLITFMLCYTLRQVPIDLGLCTWAVCRFWDSTVSNRSNPNAQSHLSFCCYRSWHIECSGQ